MKRDKFDEYSRLQSKDWCYWCRNNEVSDANLLCDNCTIQPTHYSEWNANVDVPNCPECDNGSMDVSPYRDPDRWVCEACGWETPMEPDNEFNNR